MTGRFQKMWGDFRRHQAAGRAGVSSASARRPWAAAIPSATSCRRAAGSTPRPTSSSARSTDSARRRSPSTRAQSRCRRWASCCRITRAGTRPPAPRRRRRGADVRGGRITRPRCSTTLIPSKVWSSWCCPTALVITAAGSRPRWPRFIRRGGKLVLSHRSGFDADGRWALDFLPLAFDGEAEKFPTYWRARAAFAPGLAVSDRVFYARGLNVLPGAGTEGARRPRAALLPAHRPALVLAFPGPARGRGGPASRRRGGRALRLFRRPDLSRVPPGGNLAARDGWKLATARLIGPPPFGAGLPTTVLSVPRRRGAGPDPDAAALHPAAQGARHRRHRGADELRRPDAAAAAGGAAGARLRPAGLAAAGGLGRIRAAGLAGPAAARGTGIFFAG